MTIATYLINRCPSTTINLKTQIEKRSGKPSDYNYLKFFGCLAYAYIKQDKLDARALKCVFVRYPPGVKGYSCRV